MKCLSFVFLLLLISLQVKSQNILEHKLRGDLNGKTALQIITQAEVETKGKIFFRDEWILPLVVNQDYTGLSLIEILDDLFAGTDLSYLLMYSNSLVIIKDPKLALAYKSARRAAVQNDIEIDRVIFGEASKTSAKQISISGKVIDEKTGEPLAGATLTLANIGLVLTTEVDGTFRMQLAPGVYLIEFSSPKSETKAIDLLAYENGAFTVSLEQSSIMLQEIVIEDKATVNLTTSRIGQTDLLMSDLKRAPALLGEVDIIKQVQVLPGVTTVGEAASGFNVRGGSVDQNLILYDGMPVFNSSHVFGFLSSFNAEAIGDVKFMRGGIPARYGGRASSVLDIRSKEGSYRKWSGNGGIGMITSNIMVNGPIKKEKTSMLASFRSTYSNWLIRSLRTDYGDLQKSSVYFYDGTMNFSHAINNDSKISFTNYFSKDAFRLVGDSTYQWSNFQSSLKLEHTFANGLEGEFVAGISNYGYKLLNDEYRTASELEFDITTKVLQAKFTNEINRHKLGFGIEASHYSFQPGKIRPTNNESNSATLAMNKQFSLETALYGSDEIELTNGLTMEAGVRIPFFFSFGPSTRYHYAEGSREITSIIDTVRYSRGEIAKAFVGVEPRISFRFVTGKFSSLKFGYNRVNQYLHLVSNTTAVTPVDIWQPSGYFFKPQRADQVSLGYFKETEKKNVSASVEGFYKKNTNVLDFKDGAQLILNDHLETDLLQGKGESYGIETLLSKSIGRLTGSVNYTYSRSFRIVNGPTASERINRGQRYPSNFDQPNIINLSWKYNLSKRYFFTGFFTYHTGRPVTIPLSAFALENTYVAYFSGRNQYRIPDYHRLDIAFVIDGNHRRKKRVEGHWVFSVYNVYARKNPYTVFFKSTEQGVPKPYQLSIVGTALPSVSYNLKF